VNKRKNMKRMNQRKQGNKRKSMKRTNQRKRKTSNKISQKESKKNLKTPQQEGFFLKTFIKQFASIIVQPDSE